MAKNSVIIIVILIAIITGAAGFYGGMQYQKSQRGNITRGQFLGNGNGQNTRTGNNFQGMKPVNGEITSVDSGTITIKIQDGSSKIVVYSSSTKINKTSEGSVSDLKVGEQVTAFGTEGSDETVTAQNINLGGGTFRMQPGNNQNNQPTPSK